MPRAMEIFPRAILNTRAIGSHSYPRLIGDGVLYYCSVLTDCLELDQFWFYLIQLF